MAFLNPALLALLPLAAIPIILHLITLRRLKVTELSTFRFLFESYTRQQSRMVFTNALLTALRTLFLLLLILMICRPVLKHWSALFGGRSGAETVFLVDCSASMNARTGGVSALERAKTAALTVAERLSSREQLAVWRVTGVPEEVFRQFRGDLEALRPKIEALEPSLDRANFQAAFKRVFELGRNGAVNYAVYVFTDRQVSGWKEASQTSLEQIVPPGARVIIVDVGSREAVPNHAVVGDPPARETAIVGLPVLLQARVANFAAGDPVDLTVKVYADDQEVARGSATLKAGEQRPVPLSFIPKQAGVLRGRFEIGADRFPDDDTYLFTLPVNPQVKVVLVNGRPDPDPFENEALYLRTALNATAAAPELAGGKGAEAATYRDFVRALDIREVPEGSVTPDLLAPASVVVLANCGQLNAQHFAWLRTYVMNGGGLIVFPGDLVKSDLYNTSFFPVPGPQQESLTAARLEAPAGDPQKPSTFERLAAIDFRHPVLSVFDGSDARPFATVRFYRWFPLLLGDRDRNGTALLRLSGGTAAVAESRLGKGRVLVAAFPANAKWSNLPLKPEFVPLLLRMVNHVQRRADVEAPAVAAAEAASEVSVHEDWGTVTGEVVDEAGRAAPLAFQRAGGRLVGTIERLKAKGYYKVELKGGQPGKPREGHTQVAANVAPGESDFQTLDQAGLRALMPSARVTVVDASAEAQQLYGNIGDEREVWRPMIWVLFAVIGVEFALATMRAGRAKRRAGAALLQQVEQMLPDAFDDAQRGATTKVTP